MRLPEFITFTGVDVTADAHEMAALAAEYRIEWGILFSPKRQGLEPRYPPLDYIRGFLRDHHNGMRFAAHLCGNDAKSVIHSGACRHDPLICNHFTRAQINTVEHVDAKAAKEWGDALSIGVILQCRAGFPNDGRVEWLFDKSGGRGVEQTIWPQPLPNRRCGFAGGLSANNVAEKIKGMVAGSSEARYWIDMESGVRDEHDRFDLKKCRAVCEAVYRKPRGGSNPKGECPPGPRAKPEDPGHEVTRQTRS
jgi:hypothetical protein